MELRLVLEKRGYKFESDTDIEAFAILTKHVYDPDKRDYFTELVKTVLKELEVSFAFFFQIRPLSERNCHSPTRFTSAHWCSD